MREIDKLHDWGILVNHSKTELLAEAGTSVSSEEWSDTKISDKVKYLGFTVSTDPCMIKKLAKQSIHKHLGIIKGMIRLASTQVKEQLLVSSSRSLMIYF